MLHTFSAPLTLTFEAVIEQVDTEVCELHVSANGVPLSVQVPLDCEIRQAHARAPLDCLQPGDQVQIVCTRDAAGLHGRLIEVHWFPWSAPRAVRKGASESLRPAAFR